MACNGFKEETYKCTVSPHTHTHTQDSPCVQVSLTITHPQSSPALKLPTPQRSPQAEPLNTGMTGNLGV